jgi:hypothetical protein
MSRRDARTWVATFNAAAPHLSYLCPGETEPEVIPLHAEPCLEHGGSCVRVTYGALRSHFLWAEEDPLQLLHRLMQSLIPSQDQPRAPEPLLVAEPPEEAATSRRRPRASASPAKGMMEEG